MDKSDFLGLSYKGNFLACSAMYKLKWRTLCMFFTSFFTSHDFAHLTSTFTACYLLKDRSPKKRHALWLDIFLPYYLYMLGITQMTVLALRVHIVSRPYSAALFLCFFCSVLLVVVDQSVHAFAVYAFLSVSRPSVCTQISWESPFRHMVCLLTAK